MSYNTLNKSKDRTIYSLHKQIEDVKCCVVQYNKGKRQWKEYKKIFKKV
jgi:hypothetical protein